jgi:hypothetical protein
MFERTCIRQPNDITGLGQFDLGAVAESLLFYGTTTVVLNPGSLKELLTRIGTDAAIRLARHDSARVIYEANMTTIPNAGPLPAPGWGISTASTPAWRADRLVPEAFHEVIGRRGAARRASSKFLDELEIVSPEQFRPGSDEEIIREAVSDEAVREALCFVAPGYRIPHPLRFEVSYDESAGFVIDSNLDCAAITADHQRFYKTAHEVTVSHLLLALIGVVEDVGLATYLGSDITLSPLRAALMKVWGRENSSSTSQAAASLQALALGDSRAISEAVNAGHVPFAEVLDLAEHAKQFRHWLAEQQPDSDLAAAYFREATRDTWADRLPTAIARWLVVTGIGTAAGLAVAGPIGVAAGPAIGAVDFVAGRVQGRRTPGQFLQREVRDALGHK